MIKTVKISNFKSVQELEIELGRLNVFIGENGCGKTSILEGIAMGSAASQDKPEDEFISSRGVRITEPTLMKSAFSTESSTKTINFDFENSDNRHVFYRLSNSGKFSEWQVDESSEKQLPERALKLKEKALNSYTQVLQIVDELKAIENENIQTARVKMLADIKEKILYYENLDLDALINRGTSPIPDLQFFLIFAPENHFLRRFEEEGQIRPLGIRGEGLFRHLVELSKEEPETFAAISDQLSLIDWFGGLSIPNNLSFTERRISITDRFIADTIKDFDQRSANEGFLYLLFYFTLFLSKYTPKFFAIDNIDNALNPRLCAKLVEMLAVISKEQDKQAILTTHNPAVLDGLDLTDDEQRLFVIYRNADGETKARRVKPLKEIAGVEPVRLSEAFVRGYLGGLPKNF